MQTVIISPLITERSMALVKQGKFSFKVSKNASKETIKKAIKDTFSVDVISVDTVTQKGKTHRVGSDVWKKDWSLSRKQW